MNLANHLDYKYFNLWVGQVGGGLAMVEQREALICLSRITIL